MSMLAEPRKKRKWSIDPRNTTWSNDESKFGQKMLERMGWSKGKGLGRNEQGSTENIKVNMKNNTLGLGTTRSYEDNWIAHQDDFNQLLAELNNCHGQNNGSVETPSEESQVFSLEEKSKTSKKRVHYMKFTKGKDLSRRSETDLNCIFGKRAKLLEENNGSDSPGEGGEEEKNNLVSATPEPLDSNTKISTLTMQEYFAQRMARLKSSRGQAQESVSQENQPVLGTPEEPDVDHSADHPEEPKKKKKKKKKTRDGSEVAAKGKYDKTAVMEENMEREQSCKKKQKKKKTEEGTVNGDCSAISGVGSNCREENGTVDVVLLHKKKKHRKEVDSDVAEELLIKIKKSKKKRE